MRNPYLFSAMSNITGKMEALNEARAAVAQLAAEIIAELQPLTNDTAAPMGFSVKWRAPNKRAEKAYRSVMKRAATRPLPKRRTRTTVTPGMRAQVLDLSKDKKNTAKMIAQTVGVSEPTIYNIRKKAKKK